MCFLFVPNFGTEGVCMSNRKKIEQWKNEIDSIKESERLMKQKNAARIKALQKNIDDAMAQDEVENNKLIANVVREFFGEVNDENIENLSSFLKVHGHSIKGFEPREVNADE